MLGIQGRTAYALRSSAYFFLRPLSALSPSHPSDLSNVDALGLSRVLLELHRAGREAGYSSFQPSALDSIQALIPFDSAWWGNAAAEPMEIHRLHLHNCPASILSDYVPYMGKDFFRAELMAHPGTTINMADLITRGRFVRTELYRMVGKRYHIEWSLGTLLVEPVSSLYEFLTLWRHDPILALHEAAVWASTWDIPQEVRDRR